VGTGFQARASSPKAMDFNKLDPRTPLDSLEVVQVVMGIEEAFGIEIPDEDAEKFRTSGDIIDYIERHGKRRESGKSLLKKLSKLIHDVLFGIKK
jgi:acyl carrier protein